MAKKSKPQREIIMAKKSKPRGWVFTKEGGSREIGFATPDECRDGEDALRQFGRECGNHFDIYFRNSKGELESVSPESRPEDFE